MIIDENWFNKENITWFNKNKNKNLYRKILDKIEPNHRVCKVCNDVIYFESTTFRKSKINNIEIDNQSHRLFKEIFNKKYYLSVCEDCLKIKYPNFNYKKRTFNTMNEITKFAFNIPYEVSSEWIKENVGVTLDKFIKSYGEEKGKLKWKKYCDRQSETNKFEYKKSKYGWTKEDFNTYNKSRAVTLENLVKRHGEIKGLKIWQDYVEKQILTKSKEYYIHKYGEDKWKEMNKNKAQTLENFIKRYGDKRAFEKYNEYLKKRSSLPASKSSQFFFSSLDKILSTKYTTYFYEKNGKEFGKLLSTGRYVYLDYFIKELNLNIEYNGDVFHANPKIYKKNDKPNPFTNETSQQIWKKDNEKLKLLEKEHHIKTIVIWESNLPNLNDLLKIIEKYEC
jgi:hypothetical protein